MTVSVPDFLLIVPTDTERQRSIKNEIVSILLHNKISPISIENRSAIQRINETTNALLEKNPDYIIAVYTNDEEDDLINFQIGISATKYSTSDFEEKLVLLIHDERDPIQITNYLREGLGINVRNLDFETSEEAAKTIIAFIETR